MRTTMDLQDLGTRQTLDRVTADSLGQIVHRTAQPLTTLRGICELSLSQSWTIEEHKAWAVQAMDQLQQLIANFDQIRKLAETSDAARPGREARAQSNV